jgi:site-specific recombinase XerD
VIAPSKSDRERIIPMSAELFAVIAAVIRRHTETRGRVPALSRYDTHDKVHTPPMPFLFQRQRGAIGMVFSQRAVLNLLRRRCAELATTHPQFAQARFTPHDFRRLFATELVNNGLPIHIGAALLGHLSLETTRGYVAVFEEDLVRHYQTYLERRRQLRPVEEYRPATDAEGPSSRLISTNAKSSSVTAVDPMAPAALMSMPASVAPCCTCNPRCCRVLT